MDKKIKIVIIIVVVLLALIPLMLILLSSIAYFGVLSPSILIPERCTFPTGLSCKDHSVTTSGVTITLLNGLGRSIYVTHLNISGDGVNGDCGGDLDEEILIANGETIVISVGDCDIEKGEQRFDTALKWHYEDMDATYAKTASGMITTVVK